MLHGVVPLHVAQQLLESFWLKLFRRCAARAHGRRGRACLRRCERERAVRPVPVVVGDVGSGRPTRSDRVLGVLWGESPLNFLTERGSKALDGRELRVSLACLESRHGGLRGAHPCSHGGLGEPELLAPCRELAQKLAAAQSGFYEVGEVGITLGALSDDLIEEVVGSHAGNISFTASYLRD